ncbi:acetyl-CoA synthetase [Parafrankia irregularis]|uniref:acetate--CoA ligase n=1 Tax=Parafrankia irregularis TaxID=795642 RepID=A0A0S4QWC4_9ACTN|nr:MULTISPECIES: AMP-binding protein [Parafrankia]MBE3200367.1 AMP-binding protein [Parafrankia sp. CH37]CUU59795.1 acetyl-CoA synthetase [Parafrankia irregularis]
MAYTWLPSPAYLEHTNVARLMRRLGVDTADELRAVSVADIGAFWHAVVDDLAIPFSRRYEQVVDLSRGIEYPEWFTGGQINIVDACLSRWLASTPNAPAVVHEDESGSVRELTFAGLTDQVARLRGALRARGIGPGDAVAIYLPMAPEAVVAFYAVASLGAVAVPLFSGFAAAAITARLQDARARAVITADGTIRRGRAVPMRAHLDDALADCPSVRLVVVVDSLAPTAMPTPTPITSARGGAEVVSWWRMLAGEPDPAVAPTASSDVLLLAYTSGTTGRPKGAVHTHAGFLVKTACEVAYGFDMAPGRTFCWITDMGWIMGPLSIVGTHACGGTLLLYEGAPDMPDAARLWRLAQRHRVTTLGVSPTLIRALRAASPDRPAEDLSSVRVIGSTGEPWDPESYEWLAANVFGGRVPVINFSGGTEVGGSFLCPYPVEEIASCSLGGPALGMDVDVVDESGRPLRGSVGELVCRQPWPAMTRGVWRDEARYVETYWSTFPGLWRHGDFALVDEAGGWFILGRSDDAMNVAGKRVAPAEIESVLAADPAVAESAVVGVPNPAKGESVWAFWVARPGTEDVGAAGPGAGRDGPGTGPTPDEEVSRRLRERVADQLGKPFAPSRVVRVAALPKTRSAKVLRRALRAAVLGTDPGDLSGAENPQVLDVIRAQLGDRR